MDSIGLSKVKWIVEVFYKRLNNDMTMIWQCIESFKVQCIGDTLTRFNPLSLSTQILSPFFYKSLTRKINIPPPSIGG